MMKAWMTIALANVAGIILHISVLAAVVVLWLVWKNKRVVHLLPSEPDKRLGRTPSDAGKCASTCATSHDRILPIPRNPRLSE